MFNIKISLDPYINLVSKNTKKEQKALVDKVNRRGTERRRMNAAIASIVAVDFMSHATVQVAARQYSLYKTSGVRHSANKTVEDSIKAMLLRFYETSQFEEDPQLYKEELATYFETLKEAYRIASEAFIAEVLTLRDDAKALLAHTNTHWRNDGIIRSFTMFGPNEITRQGETEYTVGQIRKWVAYQESTYKPGFKPVKYENYMKEFGFASAPDHNAVFVLKETKTLANADMIATEKEDAILIPYTFDQQVYDNSEW